MALGYQAEIDVWLVKQDFYSGHDTPRYKINFKWIENNKTKLWLHCKNIQAFEHLHGLNRIFSGYNFFWHDSDSIAVTSNGSIWAHSGCQPITDSIAVLPELNEEDCSKCFGICSYSKSMAPQRWYARRFIAIHAQ